MFATSAAPGILPIRHRAWAGLLALVVGFLLVVGDARPAAAHVELVDTVPVDGAVLDEPIDVVELRFTEVVEPRQVTVVDHRGARHEVHLGPAQVLRVPVDTDAGGWTAVSWTVISADGHPITGATTFRVGAGAGVVPTSVRAAVGETGTGVTDPIRSVGRAVGLGGLLVLAGTAFCRAFVAGTGAPAISRIARLAGAAAATGAIVAVSASATGDLVTWPGTASDLAPVVGAAAFVATRSDSRRRWMVVLVAALLSIATAGLTGHAAADARILTRVGLVAHLAAGAIWLGAVPALVVAVRGADTWEVLRRFSRAATAALAVLAIAGFATAWLLAGDTEVLTGSTWGRLLLGKVALVGVGAAAGGANRRLLRTGTRPDAVRRLLVVEAAVLLAVVSLSALLTRHTPDSPSARTVLAESPSLPSDELGT